MFFDNNFFPVASRGEWLPPKDAAGQGEHFDMCIRYAQGCALCVGDFEAFKGLFIREYSGIFEKKSCFFEYFDEFYHMETPKK